MPRADATTFYYPQYELCAFYIDVRYIAHPRISQIYIGTRLWRIPHWSKLNEG